jgi:hypothetical protein
MNVTIDDRKRYSAAIDFITENLEIIGNFSRLNGLPSFPGEELSDVVILGIKTWLLSNDGEKWLGTLGYSKNGFAEELPEAYLCPVCSGTYALYENTRCERCGRVVCHTCTSVVDHRYHIEWCSHCLGDESLTNLINLGR